MAPERARAKPAEMEAMVLERREYMKILVSVVLSPFNKDEISEIGFIPTEPNSRERTIERNKTIIVMNKRERLFLLIKKYLLKLSICFAPSMVRL